MSSGVGGYKFAAVGVGVALCAALLTACDFGGPSGPQPTAVPAVGTPGKGTPFTGPTDTPKAATETPLPSATPVAVPTARRTGSIPGSSTWRLVGMTGQDVTALGGTGKLGAPIFAGSIGLYRSDDGGLTWQETALPHDTRVTSIAISPAKEGRMYAGSGPNCATGAGGNQYRSDDGGKTWTRLPEAPASLQLDAQNPELITGIGCTGGVVRSRDGGTTWATLEDSAFVRDPRYTGLAVAVPPSDGGIIYALYRRDDGTGRIRVSTDSGKTWGGAETEYPGVDSVMVDNHKPTRAWVTSALGGLYTLDSGTTWVPDVTGLDAAHDTTNGPNGPYLLSAITGQYNNSGDLVELYVASGSNESHPGAGIFTSKDFGQVYTRFGGDLGGAAIRTMHVTREKGDSSDQVLLYAATEDGVFKLGLGSVR
jgi:photosystem II stability/assembly factor-like uncharacterized protein